MSHVETSSSSTRRKTNARAKSKLKTNMRYTKDVPSKESRVRHEVVSPYVGVDGTTKRTALYDYMAKKKGGGASRRGSHRMADAGGCEVRWYYAHFAKLRSVGGQNYYRDFGTLVHTGLAYFYAEKMERKPLWYLGQPNVGLAMQEDALGNPSWLRAASDLMASYTRWEAGDPWHALYNEEEFEATVGDLDPDGADEPARDLEYEAPCSGRVSCDAADADSAFGDPPTRVCDYTDATGAHISHVVKKVLHQPTLNNEIVTCRPDLIITRNGSNWIIDHKTAGGARNGSGRLPVLDDRYPNYTYYWQAMVNLHIVRNGRCSVVDGVEKLPIEGFMFNRIKRDIPYDFCRDLFAIPARQYAKVPTTIRAAIRRERELAVKAVLSPKSLVAHPWECEQNFKCSYARLCHTDTVDERNLILSIEYARDE